MFCRFYKKLAVGVLDECYSSDRHKATLLVVRQMNNYDSMTPLQLAVLADSKDFVAHPVCQNVLTAIWYGRLQKDDTCFVVKVLPFPSFSHQTHTHPFNGPLSRTTRVSQYQKGKTSLDFTEARDSE